MMKLLKPLTAIALGCAMLASQCAQAADDTFVNPEWANSAWYIGAGIGQARTNIDNARITGGLTANGETLSAFNVDERNLGYKLFAGKQLNQYFAIEGGYFALGKSSFHATTAQGGLLNGEMRLRGVNLDLIGQLPLSQRFSLLGRIGMNYATATDHFTGNRLNAITGPNPSEHKLLPKVGLGLEYKLSEALAVRGEVERHRVRDGVGNRGDADLMSVSLVYKFGRPAAVARVAYVAPPEPVAAPTPVVIPPAPPAPAPVPVSEKVSFAAAALFDFDKSELKPDGKAALDDLLQKQQGVDAEVMVTVGHTDSVGSDQYNLKLSQRRADAVKAYIVSKGIDGARVYTEGKGESQPLADNKKADGRAQNRRVTIEVVGTRHVKP